ncbi:MAG: putative actin family [Streblomastix strix]|uniref:Putative actin family n=1 Tax=Streblomastix strix TaxID=222440 RepID=A0A5J4VKQ2_9EUKA|nr:MAG: putative actin family [Streblomastix strix]
MCGTECAALRHILACTYPVNNGIIQNWDDMFHLWDYTFFERLKIKPENCNILLTEAVLNPLQNRKKLIETMFDKYHFRGVHVATQAVLTLYAQGLLTGVVCDSGDGVTHIIPVYQGFNLNQAVKRMDIAGRDVTKYLMELLRLRGYNFNRQADFETVGIIKEKYCYVGLDPEFEERLATETTTLTESYELPDGRVIKIGRERYRAPECLFKPHLLDIEGGGVAEQVFNSINECDIDVRPDLYEHIILSGGSTMFPGFPTRLEKEVKELYKTKILKGNAAGNANASRSKKIKITIEDPPRRKYFVFTGGSVLAQVGSKQPEFWITQKEYKEKGAAQLVNKH